MSKHWRSFTELFHKSDFQESNAGEKAKENLSPEEVQSLSGVNRRQFLGALSASAAVLATSCKSYRDEGELVPYNKQEESGIPGQDVYFASSFALQGHSRSVLIRTRDGRPLKINGNPQHPLSMGKVDSQAQALIMSLYDPDRLQSPLSKNQKTSWSQLDQAFVKAFDSKDKEIALLTGVVTSPTQSKLFQELQAKYPNLKVYSADVSGQAGAYLKHKNASGLDYAPYIALDQAKVIVSVESDFLGSDAWNESKRLFAATRNVVEKSQLGKFYALEAQYSATGMNADVRIRLREDRQNVLLAALLKEMSLKLGQSVPAQVQQADLSQAIKNFELDVKSLESLIKDLVANQGKSVFVVGPRQSQTTFDLVVALNTLLGAYGPILKSQYAWKPLWSVSTSRNLQDLAQKISNQQVATVVSFGINPAYHLAGFGFEKLLTQVESFAFAANLDESASVARWALPMTHALESWGDYGDRLGLRTLQQPMIAPIFAARQPEDYLVAVLRGVSYSDTLYREYLRQHWQTQLAPNPLLAVDYWNLSLHDGFATNSLNLVTQPVVSWNTNFSLKLNEGLLFSVKNSQNLGDGELANVGWLQELPHSVTKATWDNYLAISPAMAEKLGFRLFPERAKWSYDVAEISYKGRKLKAVLLPQPGLADDYISLELGYGRTLAGEIGSQVGVSVYPFLAELDSWSLSGVQIQKTGELHDLAITQENNAIDEVQMTETAILAERLKDAHLRRKIIQEGTLKEYLENPNFLHEGHEDYHSFDRPHEYPGVKWAMSIDLNKCIGCSECMISCNVENNIPIVGKEMVLFGREMHWIRIDRYYAGTSKEPVASVQPMLCQHCDNAPCENVCPVAATAHSPEGLNDIAYNRCVGTRYCANTCAYKVRRFNYYNYRDHLAGEHQEKPVFNLLHNPEVTVRSRGVIEKCSFCVQRINLGRADAKRKGHKWNGQGVVAACQEACPTDAIAFGNINDVNSLVRKRKEHKLTYRVLAETGTAPNIHYQAKLRNVEEKA